MIASGWRRLLAVLLVLVLSPTWLRDPPIADNYQQVIRFKPLSLPDRKVQEQYLGPFQLEGAWEIVSPNTDFGGYSALLAMQDGQFLALSDRGVALRFSIPGHGSHPVRMIVVAEQRTTLFNTNYDAEAATHDRTTDHVWIAWETTNAISRHDGALNRERIIYPPQMDWGVNDGAESLVRLADGRFLALREAFVGWLENSRHQALLFSGDPVEGGKPESFTFSGPTGFKPTDAAQLPDGRVLILMRQLTWPMPPRFSGRIAIADPARIREGKTWHARSLARLEAPLPIDNFEGIAIEPGSDGRLAIWLISDDNGAAFQRTLLWKLTVNPKDL